MEIIVKRHKNRNVQLKVVENKVVATAPYKMSNEQIREVVQSHLKWVELRVSHTTNYYAELFSLKKIMVCGEKIDVEETLQTKPYMADKKLYLPQKYFKNKDAKKSALSRYVKMLARTFLSQRISSVGLAMGVCPAFIEIKSLPQGWIKCSTPSEKKVCIDYHAIQLPAKLQTYLIVHAYLHFSCATHDFTFQKSLERLQPESKVLEKKLGQYESIKEIF